MMSLRELSDWSAGQWDEAIAPFELTRFYHGAAWLAMLEETGRRQVLRFGIEDAGVTRGYFPAQLIRKGPFRILGSPLAGSLSEFLGPTGPADFPVEEFLAALDRYCRSQRIHQLELGSPLFPPALMGRHGYEVTEWKTLEVTLAEPDRMWGNLSGKARNRIRRAERLGLVAQDSTDPGFAARHHTLVGDLFRRQGLTSPFRSVDHRALCQWLKPADQVFTIEVRHPDFEAPLASGIFPHDGQVVYSLSAAASEQGRAMSASDLMHWSLMGFAAARGLARYRMGDNYREPVRGSGFKEKFGPRPEPVYRYLRHYSVLARHARRIVTRLQRWKQRNRFRPEPGG